MDISLVDQVGVSRSGAVINHDQWVVFCDGVQIGYLEKCEGAWLQCIVSMDGDTKAELHEAVSQHIGRGIGGVAVPPAMQAVEKDEDE